MELKFFKFEGTGNDFIIIDNRSKTFPKSKEIIAQMCKRRFGIGADGLILLEEDEGVDFKMVYYNSDGQESTMCGNGGRCIVAFARLLGIIDKQASFRAIDGLHKAWIIEDVVSLELNASSIPAKDENGYVIDTGSPHLVVPVDDPDEVDVNEVGRRLRHEPQYSGSGGINVNFMSKQGSNSIYVRTYERGVEAETLSCGTGVTASALVASQLYDIKDSVTVISKGGELKVGFRKTAGHIFENISLTAQTRFVFEGKYWVYQ